MVTCGAFPALFADAGEGVPTSHTGPTIGTRTGGAGIVFGCQTNKQKNESDTTKLYDI